MKAKPIPKELVDKIELRVEDIFVPPRENIGFKGYLLKDVLVPYIDDKRCGGFRYYKKERKTMKCIYEIRYCLCIGSGDYRLSRIAYVMLNRNDPRVVEIGDHFYIINDLMVDHDEDIEIEGKEYFFVVKPDTQDNLQLLSHSDNIKKSKKRVNKIPKFICFQPTRSCWTFFRRRPKSEGGNQRKSFFILVDGWEGAYVKIINYCNKITGSNHIPDLNQAIPESCKGMSEREAYIKYNSYYVNKRKKENLQQGELEFSREENKKEKSICWLGIIPEDMKDELRYPTEEEIEIALYEAENLTEEEYDSMSEKELEDFHEKAKKIVKERMNE